MQSLRHLYKPALDYAAFRITGRPGNKKDDHTDEMRKLDSKTKVVKDKKREGTAQVDVLV